MRVMAAAFAIIVLWLLSGCVSEETRQLAQGVHLYQAKQAVVVGQIADFAKEKGALEEADHTKIIEGQQALTESTKSLSEILGEPKTPVEVDSW